MRKVEAMIEYKGMPGGFKDVDGGGRIITGYFSSFNNKDSDGDIIQKGAFKKTIAERGPEGAKLIRHLQDHDTLKAVGSIKVLQEDNFGLYFESKIGSHTLGNDYLSMCKDELITSHSIGFSTIKEQKQDASTNLMTELKLFEGSGIQFLAANQNTPVTGFKSFEDLFAMAKKLDNALKGNGLTYTDETYIVLEERLKSIYKSIGEFLTKNSTIEDISNQPNTDTKPTINVTLPDDVSIAQVKEVKKIIDYKKIIETAFK